MNQPILPDHAKSPIEDTQSMPDVRHLDINKVGIKSIRHPVIVKDKSGGEQSTVAVFDMYVQYSSRNGESSRSQFWLC
jgi:GTP cyclohydrolase IB